MSLRLRLVAVLAFDRARVEAERLQDLIDARTQQARAQDERDLHLLRRLVLGSVLLIALAIVVVGLLLRQWVLLPVFRTGASMREIARGELGRRVRVVGPPGGVLEARVAECREFGTSGVLRVLSRLRSRTVQEAVAECIEAVRLHAVDVRRDDLTCVAVALKAVAVKNGEVARV